MIIKKLQDVKYVITVDDMEVELTEEQAKNIYKTLAAEFRPQQEDLVVNTPDWLSDANALNKKIESILDDTPFTRDFWKN